MWKKIQSRHGRPADTLALDYRALTAVTRKAASPDSDAVFGALSADPRRAGDVQTSTTELQAAT
jgi:hypothetical protein